MSNCGKSEGANKAIAAGTDVAILDRIEGSERERWTGGKEAPARDEPRRYRK